jgi:hypothetical protein
MSYVPNRILLVRYSHNAVRISGSILDGLDVLAWQEPQGRKLVWMDEVGGVNRSPIVGLILVRWQELLAKDLGTARRALITNCTDILDTLQNIAILGADLVWLGVRQATKYHEEEDAELRRTTPP